MVIKIEKKLSKTGKEYVGLWFENWLVTIDRRAIYKLADKDTIRQMKVGDKIEWNISKGMILADSEKADDDIPL